ncbi:carboxypeptidase-like regulatory domain-containing protein [Microvirga sp. STS02]|uniref:DUF5686 and carboxypeptidase-like regulatory domain-containing protein n=1 Tax=Hymenobacter negativus TaxID=2795026 RepID=UPI0018DBCB67|nr:MULTISPECIES: DUF5686 and carboxypeptidase-like regulatory domain-containing protein [Bacteria]MBH8570791.1 carboxypeptidase-like regulatory domain-containing protein [Hymenobacter negativus]MBR7210528.1 carboxypeptidase-like regulatory domain-containing protein [Microvirga sp. STS02]
MKFLAPLLLVCLLALPAAAQRIVISGQVVEAANGEPVPFASIFIPKTSAGITADLDGKFKLSVAGSPDSIAVSAMGFATQRRKLSNAAVQTVLFRLKTGGVTLGEVFVSSRQPENPAFRILREVQKHKPENARTYLKAAEYDSYNRIETSLINVPAALNNRKAIRDIRALAVRQGAAAVGDPDAPLPVFASEVGSRVYQRNNPIRRREDLLHKQMRGVGPREGSILSQMLGSNFQNFDFYPNWQNVLGKDFISPIAEGGRGTYDYELQDSVFVGKDFCYKIAVTPKRSHDLAFKGTIWITQEGYALRRLDLVASPEANINFVNDLRVSQELTSPGEGPGLPTRTKLLISVRPYEKQAAMLVRYTTVSSNFVRNKIHDETGFYDQPIVSSLMEPADAPAGGLLSGLPQGGAGGYFDTHRPDTLSLSERQVFAVLDSAKQLPSVRNLLDWVDLFVNGYKRVGKLDIGPISTLYAHNDFEGSRFRIGFRTTPLISRDWLTQAFVAYGTQDGRFKYGVRESYIAERRHWTVFSADFKHDVEQTALLDNDFLDNNNLFLAASRWGRFQRPALRDIVALSVQRDLFHGFTQTLTARYQFIDPLFPLAIAPPSGPNDTPPSDLLHLNELVSESRYAPDETLVQSENRRRAVGLKRWPVFNFRYTLGSIEWYRGHNMYHKLNLAITHSVSVGYFGRLNYRIEGNYIPTPLPYIILKAPLGNQTIFYNPNAFNLMNYFEFVTDRSVSLRLDQHFEGLLLNAIPGIRTLNWRLVGTANVLYGNLSDKARDANGRSNYLPGAIREPYVEVGYGIENIFKFIRVDFLHRLTYRDQPAPPPPGRPDNSHQNFGIRFGAQFRL